MSEPIPESIPTSADPRSRRPLKRARQTVGSQQADAIDKLFEKQPDIHIPAAATKRAKTSADLAPPPEIVANVQGSSAGAGSGEFHVYKAARRREHERMRLMDEEAKEEEHTKEWELKQQENKAKDDSKTSKNRRRRQNKKDNKASAKTGDAPAKAAVGRLKPMTVTRPDDSMDVDGSDATAPHAAATDQPGLVMHDDDD